MFTRPLLLAGGLAAAVTVPYLLLDDQVAATTRGQLARLQGETPVAPPEAAPALPPIDTAASQSAAAVPVSSCVPLEEALRFDVTPEWVTGRWPRVSSVVSTDADLAGLRVALISGTQPSDIAGSLTYYFDQEHRLQRITLGGVTGDDSRLVALATGHFGLRPTQSLERGLYYGGDAKSPTSSLRISNLPVMRADVLTARFQVALDLRRADVAQIKAEGERPQKILPTTYRRW